MDASFFCCGVMNRFVSFLTLCYQLAKILEMQGNSFYFDLPHKFLLHLMYS